MKRHIENCISADCKVDEMFKDVVRGSSTRTAPMERVAQVFEKQLGRKKSEELGFHLSDWAHDAAFILALNLNPGKFTDEEINAGCREFIVHASYHVENAKRIMESEDCSMENLGDFLESKFPLDVITRLLTEGICTGIIQEVRNEARTICSKIIYEDGGTGGFPARWLKKLDEDKCKYLADIGVIVVDKLPDGLEERELSPACWICLYSDAELVSAMLRYCTLCVSRAKQTRIVSA